jgi:hypothetical protein
MPLLMALLRAGATLKVDDCWIGAGAARNAVWDCLHNYPLQLASGSDVDVIYFDPISVNSESDVIIERRLSEAWTGILWSVRNQAGMHERNGDEPYVTAKTLSGVGRKRRPQLRRG